MESNDAAIGRAQYDSLNVDLSRIPDDRSQFPVALSAVRGTQITEKPMYTSIAFRRKSPSN